MCFCMPVDYNWVQRLLHLNYFHTRQQKETANTVEHAFMITCTQRPQPAWTGFNVQARMFVYKGLGDRSV